MAVPFTVLYNQLCRIFLRKIWNTVFFYVEILLGCTLHSGVIDTSVKCTHRCAYMAQQWLWTSFFLLSLATFAGNIDKKNRQIVLHDGFNLHTKNMGVN
jgi:hypothetical protein